MESALLLHVRNAKRRAVIWADAWYENSEASSDEHKHEPVYYCTEGFLIKSDEQGISLAQEIGEDGRFRGRTFILRSLIVKEWELPTLRIPRKPRQRTSSPDPPSTPE